MKSKDEILIKAAKELHRAVVNEIELMMQEDSDPDQLIDAVVRFESIYWPITSKDRSLVRDLLTEAQEKDAS